MLTSPLSSMLKGRNCRREVGKWSLLNEGKRSLGSWKMHQNRAYPRSCGSPEGNEAEEPSELHHSAEMGLVDSPSRDHGVHLHICERSASSCRGRILGFRCRGRAGEEDPEDGPGGVRNWRGCKRTERWRK